jgi:hypothetical protein
MASGGSNRGSFGYNSSEHSGRSSTYASPSMRASPSAAGPSRSFYSPPARGATSATLPRYDSGLRLDGSRRATLPQPSVNLSSPPQFNSSRTATTRDWLGEQPRSSRTLDSTQYGLAADRLGSGSGISVPKSVSEVRGQTPEVSAPKSDSVRTSAADLRGRIPDVSGPKSERSPLKFDGSLPLAGKGGGKDTVKRDPSLKLDAPKTLADRPAISDLRNRIPNVDSGKSGPSPKLNKLGADATNVLGKGPADLGKGKTDVGKLPSSMTKPGGGSKLPGTLHTDPTMKLIGPKTIGPKTMGLDKSKLGSEQLTRARFSERLQKGDLDRLTKGEVARKVKLADQYRLSRDGDVARRLALHNRVGGVVNMPVPANLNRFYHPHPGFIYRGWVSPIYHRHCFEYRCWWGPSWYPRIWWYPRWVPWVNWCWYYPCNPYWDPRPFWCRPVTYVVVTQPWVYYDVPAWTPLPAITAGTWVDVEKPVVAAEQYDLQLLAVRFVDPGHPDEKLGPRYRVWFRNNSPKPITQAFNVMLLAGDEQQPGRNAPQAGVRVTAVEAGDTQSVDIRLPFDATQGPGPQANAAPFKYLHVLLDANQEINDVNRANNGVRLTPGEILPVDPAAFETDPKSVPAGGEVILAGEGFGPEPGKVLVHLGGVEMEAEILGWYDLGVRMKMPELPLAGATQAELIVIRGDGAAANPLAITVNPPQRPGPEMNAPALPPPPQPVPPK